MINEGNLLKQWIDSQGLTGAGLATKLGLTRANIYYHLKQQQISIEFKNRLSQAGYTIEKLGVKSLSDKKSNPISIKDTIPVYDVPVTAGGQDNVSQISEQPSYRVSVPGYEDCNFGLQAYGHSMYPTIESGSLLLCRKVKDKGLIMYGEVYVIRTADYLMVKRLQKNGEPASVLCTSDNFEKRNEQFKRFEPFELPIDKIIDLYLVKGIIKKTQS